MSMQVITLYQQWAKSTKYFVLALIKYFPLQKFKLIGENTQDKFEMFDELPQELKLEIAKSLSSRDLVNFAQASQYYLALFKPLIDVRKLLHHVMHG
jgi:hypothetical protein